MGKTPKITENWRNTGIRGSKNSFFDPFPASFGLLSTFFGLRATFRCGLPYWIDFFDFSIFWTPCQQNVDLKSHDFREKIAKKSYFGSQKCKNQRIDPKIMPIDQKYCPVSKMGSKTKIGRKFEFLESDYDFGWYPLSLLKSPLF